MLLAVQLHDFPASNKSQLLLRLKLELNGHLLMLGTWHLVLLLTHAWPADP
jgi:hypothetical protein